MTVVLLILNDSDKRLRRHFLSYKAKAHPSEKVGLLGVLPRLWALSRLSAFRPGLGHPDRRPVR